MATIHGVVTDAHRHRAALLIAAALRRKAAATHVATKQLTTCDGPEPEGPVTHLNSAHEGRRS